MTAPAVEAAVIAEIERVHPQFIAHGLPDGFVVHAAPDPCEVCGTRVFPGTWGGRIGLFHVGFVHDGAKALAIPHTPRACSNARRTGVRLEGQRVELRPAQSFPSPGDTETTT